ncbi:MAG: 30S ribosomal protein S1 [Bacteroidota bacterium]|nr:30S ribosomal protein S1 [Bacteroidota bacterium]
MSEKKKPTAKKTEKKTTKATSKKTKATPKTKSENTIEEVSTDEVVEQSATKSEVSKESVVEDSPKEETVDQAIDEKEKEITSDSQEEATSHENTVESEETTFDDSLAATTPNSQEEDVDFDWESFEKGDEEYTTSEREVLEKDYLSTLNTIESDQVIDGRVVSITDREVIVNINYKSDGIISRNEFRYKEDFQVGDTVEVLVEKKEDKKGQLILSHKKARVFRSWEKVNEAFDKDIVVEGLIKCRTKGGMIVEVLGLEAFLPGSQIDIKPIRDYDEYVGKKMEFKVVKINHEFRNVVVSHKALIEADLEEQKKEIMTKLEVGQVLEGTVKNITSYGVFIDLGGIDGLIHITDLSWGRVNHPDEIVELDSTINVVILEFDDDKKRIQLGLKQLTSHPWDALEENIAVGDTINGKVVVVADYGAFVEVKPGVEALVHVSEMSWSTHLRSASDFLKVGQEIEAQILTLDREERKMSLGMKQLQPDPWNAIVEKFPAGSEHKVLVRNFTNFGIFVELEEGVDGLIHISDLSWEKKIKHPSEFTKVGSEIQAKVLELDMESRKISLGVKQLQDNPWDGYESTFFEGSEHEGEVGDVTKNGATITLTHGVEAFAPKRHLAKEDGSKVEKGEKLQFRVLEFLKDSQKIVVSHSVIFKQMKNDQEKRTKEKVKRVQNSQQKSTLGDMDELIALKESMNKKEKK